MGVVMSALLNPGNDTLACLLNVVLQLISVAAVTLLIAECTRRQPGLRREMLLAMSALVVCTTIGLAHNELQPEPDSPVADNFPAPEDIEYAKQLFRKSRDDVAARTEAAKVLYPLITPRITRSEVRNLLGSPDRFPGRDDGRFLNYMVGPDKRIEIEFDRERRKVAYKFEIGLGIDPPKQPTPAIPEKLKAYLADYKFDAKEASDRTVLRAGFTPYKPQIVWREPMTVTMTAANIGNADFRFMFGGDYRGTGRHDRVKIVVTDADGNELPDPHANAPDFGGISSFELITPGGLKFTRTFDLTKFRTITEPGQYTVTCSFGFDESYAKDPRKPVIKSSFPFTILARTPQRVTAVLDELQAKTEAASDEQLPEAMAAIARFGQEDAVPRLDEYTKTGETAQRTAAFAALPLIPGEAALEVALAGLEDANREIRIAAASALGRMPQDRSILALLNALDREQGHVKGAFLVALGTSKSKRGLAVLTRILEEGPAEMRSAAVEALVQFGGAEAIATLRQHVDTPNLPFRYQVVNALASKLRSPLDPNWLLPVLMCRRHNNREWLDSLGIVRIWSGTKAVPVLLSCVDYDVPWSHRNFWILHHVKYAKDAPEFDYIYNPNSVGTPDEREKNRQTLKMLREFSGPISRPTVWPAEPVPALKTDPPIDFTATLTPPKDAETRATIKCGFFQESWDRNGGSTSFRPTEAYRPIYQVASDVRAILESPERAEKSGLTEQQLEELRQLELPPRYPVIKEGLSLLYMWWQESPDGPIRERARDYLVDRVRDGVQQYHIDNVSFAPAARKIMGAGAT
jgi:hypothetical protein